jgi:transcriptional regulator with XRE-family HTH domain
VNLHDQETLKSIAAAVRGFREMKGMTQEKLAQLVEIHPTTLSRIERGELDFSVLTFFALCRVLERPPEQLLVHRRFEKRGRGRPNAPKS